MYLPVLDKLYAGKISARGRGTGFFAERSRRRLGTVHGL
jgi:hypothetical protein